MNHTIQLTAEQFEALQSGQSITIEPPKPAITKWEPIKGNYYIEPSNGYVTSKHCTMENYRLAGLEYSTQTQAEHAAKAIRSYVRQLAWLAENDDGWVAAWSNRDQNKYFVTYSHECKNFQTTSCYEYQYINNIFMSKANAIKLVQLMNDGIVEF